VSKPAFLWGTTSSGGAAYGKTLTLGYPLYDVVTDREPREGSEWLQAPSGVEDAWITGRDYVMTCAVRWVPDSTSAVPSRSAVAAAPAQADAWQNFLDYCRDKNPFRFCPDAALTTKYVDACYLVEPMRGFGQNLENLTRGVTLKIRNANVDFTRALLGQTSSG